MSTEELQQFNQEFIQELEKTLPNMSKVFQKYGLSPEAFQLEINLTQIQVSGEGCINQETTMASRKSAGIIVQAICPFGGGTKCIVAPTTDL